MSKFSEQAHAQVNQLKQNKYVLQARAWYDGLNQRDQRFVKVVAILFVSALLFNWIWHPVMQMETHAQKRYESALKLHQHMKDNAPSGTSTSTTSNDGSLLGIVNSIAKAKGVTLKRFEPNGTTGLRVWLDKVDFNKAIDWIETLEASKGITAEQMNIEKVNSGIVNIRAVFKS